MSWICKNCETENPDILDVCEVCETRAPRIVDFKYDRFFSGEPVVIRWKAEECDNISIYYKGETIDVSGKSDYSIDHPDESSISFILSNSVTTARTISYTLDFIECPSITITSDKSKLVKGCGESAVLSWNIENANKAFLIDGDNKIEISLIGKAKVSPAATTTYKIEVLALDNKTTFDEELEIDVYDECTLEFEADKYYIYPTIPVVLSWKVTNAKGVTLDGETVEAEGKKVIEPKKAVTCVLSAEDEFGIKEKQIDIRMLPVPQIKALLVPTPKIRNNLSITIKQPKYNVEVRFPKIDFGFVTAEVPKVPSFTDLGINVELSPPLPKLNLRRAIKNVFNYIKK